LKAPDLKAALLTMGDAKTLPSGLLVDYHLDSGNGIEAIAALRWRFGQDLPAILITADRSPLVREEARARDIQVLNKPLKPAALPALIAQWRWRGRGAAEWGGGGRLGSGEGRVGEPPPPPFAPHPSPFAPSPPPLRPLPASIFAAAITAWVRLSTPSFCR